MGGGGNPRGTSWSGAHWELRREQRGLRSPGIEPWSLDPCKPSWTIGVRTPIEIKWVMFTLYFIPTCATVKDSNIGHQFCWTHPPMQNGQWTGAKRPKRNAISFSSWFSHEATVVAPGHHFLEPWPLALSESAVMSPWRSMNPSATSSSSSLLHKDRQGMMEAKCKHRQEQRRSSNWQSFWVRSSWQKEGHEEHNDSSLYVKNNWCVTYLLHWSVDLTMWFVSRWLQNVTNFGESDSRSFTCTHPLGTVMNQRLAKMLWSSYGEPRKCNDQEIIRRMELLLENQMHLQEQYSKSQWRRNWRRRKWRWRFAWWKARAGAGTRSAGSGGGGSCRNTAPAWKLAMVQEQDTGME